MFIYEFPLSLTISALAGLSLYCHVQYADHTTSSPGWPLFALHWHVQYAWNTELDLAGDPSLYSLPLTTSHYLWVSVHTAVYIHVLNTELSPAGDPSLPAASHYLSLPLGFCPHCSIYTCIEYRAEPSRRSLATHYLSLPLTTSGFLSTLQYIYMY